MNDGDPLIRGKSDGVEVTKCLVEHFEDFCFYSKKHLEGFEQRKDMILAYLFLPGSYCLLCREWVEGGRNRDRDRLGGCCKNVGKSPNIYCDRFVQIEFLGQRIGIF